MGFGGFFVMGDVAGGPWSPVDYLHMQKIIKTILIVGLSIVHSRYNHERKGGH